MGQGCTRHVGSAVPWLVCFSPSLSTWTSLCGIGMSLLDSAINPHTLHLVFRIVYALWHAIGFLVSLLVVTTIVLEYASPDRSVQSAFILVNARGWPPFTPRAGPGDREVGTRTRDATVETDIKPLIDRLTRPRTRLPRRSFRPRHSRIPDRLCRPSGDAGWL